MNISERMKNFNVPGVSISYFSNAKVEWSKHFGTLEKGFDKDVNNDSIFHACSISKMITSLCVLKLFQDGMLDLHKDVNEYLLSWKIPDSKLTDEKKVTLSNLLAHQAGFYDCEGSFSPYRSGSDIPQAIDILKGTSCYNPAEVHVEYVPETDCEYSDAGYCVISQILQDVLPNQLRKLPKELCLTRLG